MLDTFLEPLLSHPLSSSISFILPLLAIYVINILFFHPLSNVPGPLLRRLTSIPLLYSCYIGTESSCAAALHKKYGPIVLTAPNDVDVDDGAAVYPIYVHKGGFSKPKFYSNADLNGHQTLFSTLHGTHRAARAKAVVPLFATGKLRSTTVFEECVDDFIEVLRTVKAKAKTNPSGEAEVDMLDLGRRLALDALSSYAFGRRNGAVREFDGVNPMPANGFVEYMVVMTSIFLAPRWIFQAACLGMESLWLGSDHAKATRQLFSWVGKLVDDADSIGGETYQQRLLRAGLSKENVVGECLDAILAGTVSLGDNLSSLIWHLVQNPQATEDLAQELQQTETPPLLAATVRESLRLAMVNPTRLARTVPAQGWTYTPSSSPASPEPTIPSSSDKEFRLPAGTRVGISPFSLHYNDETFPSPRTFKPSRWLDTGKERGSEAMETMNRDWFAFGAGNRQCIARNMATEVLTVLARRVVQSGVLEGARTRDDEIVIFEWFASRVKNEKGYAIYWGA